MTADPHDPPVPVMFCMFERCWSTRAERTTIERVTRDLCAIHEAIVREALESEGRSVAVRWGQPVGDEIAEIDARVAALVAHHGEPPTEYLTPDDRVWTLDDVPCPAWSEEQCRAWDAIELARDEIATLRDRQHQEPVVRIEGRAIIEE